MLLFYQHHRKGKIDLWEDGIFSNFNKENNWTPYEPATENYISVEVEDNLTAETLEEE